MIHPARRLPMPLPLIIVFLWLLSWFFSYVLAIIPVYLFHALTSGLSLGITIIALIVISWFFGE